MAQFYGGVHPPENKFLTESKPIVKAKVPHRVVIHLQQHIGVPAKPLVSVGDIVRVGDVIGEAQGFVSAAVHASISGTVRAVGLAPHPLGRAGLAVSIEGDGEDEWIETQEDKALPPKHEIKEVLQKYGIVGLGGATFPTHVKVSPPKEKPIDTYIINGAECEPYLTADHRVMLERPRDVVKGLLLLLHLMEVPRGIIAVEENKPDAIAALRNVIDGGEFGKYTLEVISMGVKYPQGAEKQLIYGILGREIPSGKLPMDVGVIVNNVGTVVSIKEAVLDNKPLVERVVTVSGRGVVEPKNLLARIGTPFKFLISECGGFRGTPSKILMGGPMMGITQYSDEVSTVKGTSGITVLTEEDAPKSKQPQRACIRCGRCVSSCPMGLMPNMLALFASRFMLEEALTYYPMDCIECGSCAYSCPAKIPIVQLIRYLKQRNMAKLRKKG